MRLLPLLLFLSNHANGQFKAGDKNFVLIKKGVYLLGEKGHNMNPLHQVAVPAFYISKYEVTNAEFEKFVKATGYVTIAEVAHNALVFAPPLEEYQWKEDSTAYWRFPNGIALGGIENKMDHPVTCICFKDIQAYCTWAGVRLPTLDEWEVAARAGSSKHFFFGAGQKNISAYANIWKGKDHLIADSSDGFMYTSPVGSFKPNAYGLYDMYGNVFEYCSDRKASLADKTNIAQARGGSWWCSSNTCSSFNSVDCGRNDVHASFSNQGFRVVR